MKQVPLYTTHGEWAAMLVNDYFLYNPQGDWIGFLDLEKNVYSVRGEYVGWLAGDGRVLRKRATATLRERRQPPPAQPRLKFPPTVPLPPLIGDLRYDTVDVFEEMPERLDPYDMDQVADID